MTDAQWREVAPLLRGRERQRRPGRPPTVDPRRVLDALWYMNRTERPWRMLPRDFPAGGAVRYYFATWQQG